jgi:hypothetical protein
MVLKTEVMLTLKIIFCPASQKWIKLENLQTLGRTTQFSCFM